jgi:hypothetical protein
VTQLAGLLVLTLRYRDGIPQGRIRDKKIRIIPPILNSANIMLKQVFLNKKNNIINTNSYIHIKLV